MSKQNNRAQFVGLLGGAYAFQKQMQEVTYVSLGNYT